MIGMYLSLPDRLRKFLQVVMDLALFGCATVGFVCLMLDLGWNLSMDDRFLALGVTQFVLWLFVAQEAFRPLLAENFRQYLRLRWPELLLALVFAGELFVANFYGEFFLIKLGELFPHLHPLRLMLASIAGVGVIGGFLYFIRSARTNQWLSLRKLSPSWALILGFAGLIVVGTLLLKMPNSQAQPVGWMDCWFVSTSAVCVTGLSPVNTAQVWTPLGQGIILVLIQLGGLGVMTFTYFVSYFLSGGLSLRERVVLRDLLNEDNIGFIGQMLLMIGGATLVIEGIGTAWFYFSFDFPAYVETPLFYSFFHTVSGFCNAGFSLFPTDLRGIGFENNFVTQLCLMSMIVLGGIGFPTLKNIWDCALNWFKRRVLRRQTPHRHWSTNTRLAVGMTAGLLLLGAVGFYAFQCLYVGTSPDAATPNWRIALFSAVTCRTAGFSMDDVALWSVPAALLGIFLMFIGGSPGGTAGGVRTTTFAVGCANAWQMLREKSRLDIFTRSFPPLLAQRAFAVVLLSCLYISVITLVLIIIHPQLPPLNLLFETVSAFTTTGLSRATSGELSDTGKALISVTMLVGRVGILVMAMAFVPKAQPGRVLLPKGNILLS